MSTCRRKRHPRSLKNSSLRPWIGPLGPGVILPVNWEVQWDRGQSTGVDSPGVPSPGAYKLWLPKAQKVSLGFISISCKQRNRWGTAKLILISYFCCEFLTFAP